MKYRPEIDGLRALAVLPVILFHAGFEWFSGGFVGVDVFFVISGYLITTLLIEDIENKRFSLLSFYERRARRILPALLLVMICCVPFAWMWMLPEQMEDFSQSLVAASLFGSNFLFWQESGYFATASELKPLLHTWSLAVEEQYYILFPIFLFLAWRFGKDKVFWMIVAFAVISLMLSEWGWRNKPAANFYLAPTRVWELFAGSIAAFFIHKRGVQESNALSLLGLVAIIFSMLAYDKNTPFPSVYTLIPVIGSVLFIVYAHSPTIAAKLLSIRGFVGIGLISYSAYLWHQPLFAFARIRSVEAPSELLMIGLGVFSLVLAYFSWKFVETPFRDKERFSRKGIFIFSAFAILVPVSLGVCGSIKDGFAKPIPPLTSFLTQQEIWVLGDSHGAHLIPGFKQITDQRVRDLTNVGCIPFRDVDRYDSRFERGVCARTMNTYLDEVITADPEAVIVLSSMGPVYLDGTSFNEKAQARVEGLGVELITQPELKDRWRVYEMGMRNTLRELSKLERATVVFAIDIPELGIDLGCGADGKLIKTPWFEISDMVDELYHDQKAQCYIERSVYDKRAARYKKLVYDVASEFPRIRVFDPTDIFCNQDLCLGYKEDYGFLYRDVDHLSFSGSTLYAKEFGEWLFGAQ